MKDLGELLIYLGFALLAMHWLPLAMIAIALAVVWLPNMSRKDRPLARYAELAAYQQPSKLFIPFLFRTGHILRPRSLSPPSTGNTTPVMYDACARNTTACATSSGLPQWPNSVRRAVAAICCAS
jgi:hypothetical protein